MAAGIFTVVNKPQTHTDRHRLFFWGLIPLHLDAEYNGHNFLARYPVSYAAGHLNCQHLDRLPIGQHRFGV